MQTSQVALITGAARRIGAAIAERLHGDGYNVIIHYSSSIKDAERLHQKLEAIRPSSSKLLAANLNDPASITKLAEDAQAIWGRIDVLINNASSFYPTPIEHSTMNQWQAIMDVNVRAPYLMAKYLHQNLSVNKGCIINITDIYADRPLKFHSIYSASKAALVSLTKSLAAELAPNIRVNAVSPGAIIWPENDSTNIEDILNRIPLNRRGSPQDITDAVHYLLNTNYVTGQILKIDGGRSTVP